MELSDLTESEEERNYQILLFKFLETVEKEDPQHLPILQPAFEIAANQFKRLPFIGSHVTIDWCVWTIDVILLLPYKILVSLQIPHKTITDGCLVMYSITVGHTMVIMPDSISVSELAEKLRKTINDIKLKEEYVSARNLHEN